jgi:hypothetical protein
MRNYNSRLTGIFGALIIHLIAAIIFITIKMGQLSEKANSVMLVEFNENVDQVTEQKPVEASSTGERFTNTDALLNEQITNIARNLANQSDEKINVEEYIDMVKEELIKSGKLGADNYIDEQKRNRNISEAGGTEINNQLTNNKLSISTESQKMAAEFSGPTRIYYNLPGRYHTYMAIPIYKCEGSGIVTLNIEVTSTGTVIRAEVISSDSTTSEECLIETAVNAALISRFNPDAAAEKVQKGTLTYNFVAQ